jgi:regulator of sigma E protease
MSYIVVFAAIALMSLLHEAGHAMAARAFGLQISCISVGLGPPFARLHAGTVEVLLCVIPFGGYVRVVELADDTEGARASLPVRLAVTVAGSAMNYAVAAALAICIALAWGADTGRVQGLEVTMVSEHASAQGLRVGDVILRADDQPVDTVEALQSRFEHSRTVRMALLRGGTLEQIQASAEQGRNGIGARYVPKPELVRSGVIDALAHGAADPFRRSAALLSNAGAMLHRSEARRPLSPVGLGARVAQSGRWDLRRVLSFAALLSVVVGLFNLLPFPGLDGGKLTIALGEAALRRRLQRRTALALQVGGALLLVAAWFVLFVLDVVGLR